MGAGQIVAPDFTAYAAVDRLAALAPFVQIAVVAQRCPLSGACEDVVNV